MSKKIILTSGGLESTIAMYQARENGDFVRGIYFNFGRKSYEQEIYSVQKTSLELNIPIQEVNISGIKSMFNGIMKPQQFLFEADVIDPDPDPESHEDTVISYLPAIIELAILYARQAKFDSLIIGLTKEQLTKNRLKALQLLIDANNEFDTNFHKVKIETPFLEYSKGEVLEIGEKLKVDLASTWSCFDGFNEHCGECNSCLARKDAFKKAKIDDKTIYSK